MLGTTQWHWRHDCDKFPVEIILEGQSKPSEAALVSIFVARSSSTNSHSYPQRVKLHDFKFYPPEGDSKSHLRILEYLEPSQSPLSTLAISSPAVKALILDTERRRFIGCPAPLEGLVEFDANTTARHESFYRYAERCTMGGGTFEKQPYLRFAINPSSAGSGNSTVYLHAESREWAYPDDAPSVSLRYTGGTSATPADLAKSRIALRSALTKRNNPTILKMCSNEVHISLETLAPLGVIMGALNRFSVFISRPRVLST